MSHLSHQEDWAKMRKTHLLNHSLNSVPSFHLRTMTSTFLHSTPERPDVLGSVTSETVCQDQFNMEPRDNPETLSKTGETLFEIHGIDPIASAIENL